jgi:enoyl-CoA hydratase/carnithine racemase
MKTQFLDIRVADGVAFVSLNNPPMNILDMNLMMELGQFVSQVRENADVRVIVFQSAVADFFSAHGDMNFIVNPVSFGEVGAINPMQQLHMDISSLPQITIAKIAGYVRGGGHELALACDMRFGSLEGYRAAQPETLMGIIPGGGGTQFLAKLAGGARALEVILGGELFDAVRAEQYGLINRAMPGAELDAYVAGLAKRIGGLPAGVAQAAKRAVLQGSMEEENRLLMELFVRPVTVERAVAALAKGAQTVEGEKDLERILRSL